jgi:hypothetical protein
MPDLFCNKDGKFQYGFGVPMQLKEESFLAEKKQSSVVFITPDLAKVIENHF